MSNKPTGVFVRLPLSEKVLATFNSKLRIEYDVKRDIAHLGGVEGGILAIGTPVTGKNLDCAVIIEQDDKRYMPEVVSYQPHMVKPKQILHLVRQSDAQAQIAALEAEVVCLRERYGAIRWRFIQDARIEGRTLTERQFDALVDNDDEAHKSLKGGAP